MTHKYQGAVKPQSHPRSVRHYRLTNDEWLRACTELKPAEMKVLYYLRTLDPWGDKNLEIGVTDIAKILKCNKGTVSRALKALDVGGWIDLEINTATVKLQTKNSTSVPVLSTDNGVVSGSQSLSTDNSDDRQTTLTISTQHSAPETKAEQGVQIALNSLNLITPTTPDVCVSEPVNINEDPEVRTEVGVFNRPPAQVKNADPLTEALPPEQETYAPPILLAAKKKFQLNLGDASLRRAIERWPERVEIAIACLEEKQLTVKYPTRFLQRAIEDDWKPENRTGGSEWRDWFNEAYNRGLVSAGREEDGVQYVLTADDHWVPFEHLRRQSWDELEAQLKPITVEAQAAPDELTQAQIIEAVAVLVGD